MSDLFVHEVFSGIQGEGRYVGVRQIFLRLSGCNIRCAYCDEPDALLRRPGACAAEVTPGRRDFESVPSPMEASEAGRLVLRLNSVRAHPMVSVTGGEPLTQPEGLSLVLPSLREAGLRISFETNGMRVEALGQLVRPGDVVSMDVKLNSVDGESVDPALQRSFLETALELGAEVYLKAVVGPETDEHELAFSAGWVSEVDPSITLFLQPVTPFGKVTSAPDPEQVLRMQELAMDYLRDVRVVPQTHKIIGQK